VLRQSPYHTAGTGVASVESRPARLQDLHVEVTDTLHTMTSKPSINPNYRTEHDAERAVAVTALGHPCGEAVEDRPEQR